MSMDQVHRLFTSTTPKCVIDETLHAGPILNTSDSRQKLRYLRNRVIGEVANSTMCVQFGKFSVDKRCTYSDSGSWFVSSLDTADSDGGRVEIGAFGKLTLEVVKPEHGEVQIGVSDVANIFQSIWAKLNGDISGQETACMLPPFEGRLIYGTDSETDVYKSWRLSYTEDSLEWFVQERQGLDFRTLPGLFYVNKHGLQGNAPTATRRVDVFELSQNKDFDYDQPEAFQPSSGLRDDLLVDGQWPNNSSSIASESSGELPRADSPTINFDFQPGFALERNIRTGLSPATAHDDFTTDRAWPLPETPLSNIYSNVGECREGRYSGSNRASRSAEEVRGYRDQPKVRMPKGPYSRLESYSDHRYQHLGYTDGGRESFVVEASESHLDQSLDDQVFRDQEMGYDDAFEHHNATNRLSYQVDTSSSLHLLSEFEKSESEASYSSDSRPGEDALQILQTTDQHTIYTPRWSWKPEDDQVKELVKDGPEVLPLRDQFGENHQFNVLPPVFPDVFIGNSDSLNYRDHSTGGLTFVNPRTISRPKKLWNLSRALRSRISSRVRKLRSKSTLDLE